jgi:hypothetical protein
MGVLIAKKDRSTDKIMVPSHPVLTVVPSLGTGTHVPDEKFKFLHWS